VTQHHDLDFLRPLAAQTQHVQLRQLPQDRYPNDRTMPVNLPPAEGNGPIANDFGLSRRELDVLRVLTRGLSNTQIAAELFISGNTVATHVA
jgi:ATP/maltotriose-dependent transcriptional regulator MalT